MTKAALTPQILESLHRQRTCRRPREVPKEGGGQFAPASRRPTRHLPNRCSRGSFDLIREEAFEGCVPVGEATRTIEHQCGCPNIFRRTTSHWPVGDKSLRQPWIPRGHGIGIQELIQVKLRDVMVLRSQGAPYPVYKLESEGMTRITPASAPPPKALPANPGQSDSSCPPRRLKRTPGHRWCRNRCRTFRASLRPWRRAARRRSSCFAAGLW